MKQYAKIWQSIDPKAEISIQPTIRDALELAKQIGDAKNGMQTFVTGTTMLIGPALEILEGH